MRHARRPALAWLAPGLLLVAAACTSPAGGSSDTTQPPPATTAAPTTTATPTTTAAPTTTTTTTTAAPTTTSTTTTTTSTTTTTTTTSTAPPTNDRAEGSGCTPGAGPLPDGTWYGIIVDHAADEFDFDLACFFTGEAAIDAAAEDGAEPPANDIYVRNVNPTLRTIAADSDTPVVWFPNFGDPTTEATTTYAEYVVAISDRGFTPGVWLEIDGGELTEIREQWVP